MTCMVCNDEEVKFYLAAGGVRAPLCEIHVRDMRRKYGAESIVLVEGCVAPCVCVLKCCLTKMG